MKFSEADLQSYALPLGEMAKEQCLTVLAEILQTLKSMGWQVEKSIGLDNLFKYKVELMHRQYGGMVLLPMGSYGNDTRGDKQEPLEIGIITTQPIAELGHQLAFRLMGGYADAEAGLGTIFMDIGPSKATIVRIGYETEAGMIFYNNEKKITANPLKERVLGDEKHRVTDYSYKKLVRVIKKLHCMMCGVDCAAAKRVDPYLLERLFLALEVEELKHFEGLGEKLKYCILRLGLLLENKPMQFLVNMGETGVLKEEQLADYQSFFAELSSFCEIE